MSQAFVRRALEALAAQGVSRFCVCAGSRNSPLVAALVAAKGVEVFSFFEERSAAFFALGLIKSTGAAVGVVTTSGTAACELLPASVEAYYSGLPLVLVTADRPRSYRNSGAPQSIEQKGIFGVYAPLAFDLDEGEEFPSLSMWTREAPLHLNLCFDEPLLSASVEPFELKVRSVSTQINFDHARALSEFTCFLARCKNPLLLVGAIAPEDRDAVKSFLLRWKGPYYLEASSNLRQDPSLAPRLLKSGERILSRGNFDGVLRLGGIPHLRFWRDLESRFKDWPVLCLDHKEFLGLQPASGRVLVKVRLAEFLKDLDPQQSESGRELLSLDAKLYEAKLALFAQEPHSEPALIHSLSRLIPSPALVFLGNSLPIREWDLAATFKDKNFVVEASRGANGIDGQLSTFLGLAAQEEERSSWGIFGDLTTLYDLSAPWIFSQLAEADCHLVVINNGGGRIFSRLRYLRDHVPEGDRERVFENKHNLDFEAWARMWNLGYERWDRVPSFLPGASRGVVEIVPFADSTARFWKAFEALWDGP